MRSYSDETIRACLHEDDAAPAGTLKDPSVWSDDEVELLLSRVNDYKTSSGVDWDTVRLKHMVIRQVFPNVSKNVQQPVPFFSVEIYNLIARAALLSVVLKVARMSSVLNVHYQIFLQKWVSESDRGKIVKNMLFKGYACHSSTNWVQLGVACR